MRKAFLSIIGLAFILSGTLPVGATSLPTAEVENLRHFYGKSDAFPEGTGIVVPDAVDVALHEARGLFEKLSDIPNAIACKVLVREGSRDPNGLCKDWLK